jgi:hypothetical protein
VNPENARNPRDLHVNDWRSANDLGLFEDAEPEPWGTIMVGIGGGVRFFPPLPGSATRPAPREKTPQRKSLRSLAIGTVSERREKQPTPKGARRCRIGR